MSRLLLLVIVLALPGFAAAAEPTRAEFDEIIAERCLQCHTRERIDAAIARGDQWPEIREKMLRFGAELNKRETEVMGVFWVQPQGKPTR